jgi:type VI secretion system protein ImpK
MTDKDRPGNPFGRGERTTIRPNPGGRLPPAPLPPQAPSDPLPRLDSPPPTTPVPASAYAPAPATLPTEDWISTPTRPAPAPAAGQPLRMLRVDELVAPNANPIMRAAGPLLQLLGRLRVALLRASFASLMEQVAEAIEFFEKDIRSAGISEQQANSAKYVLCATADDIVQHTTSGPSTACSAVSSASASAASGSSRSSST